MKSTDRILCAQGFRAVHIGAEVLLDGNPATVQDAEQGRFAEIRDRCNGLHSAVFAWRTVAYVIREHEGRFYS